MVLPMLLLPYPPMFTIYLTKTKDSFSIDVTVNLTTSSGTVLEGESYPVCVALSQRIARRLDIVLHIRGNTADSSKYKPFRILHNSTNPLR